MKLLFTGTCAHDYSPKLKDELKNKLDKDARRSSGALLDGHFQIDCGDHTVEALEILGVDFADIDGLFLTHLHGDHYKPESIKKIAAAAARRLRIFAHKAAKQRLEDDLAGSNVEIIPLEYCTDYEIDGYTVAALPANHQCYPAHYLIEKDGKKLYYATDGAWIMYDAFYYLKNKQLDLLVLDATVGDYEGDYRVAEHNSIPMIRLMLKSFGKFNVLKDSTRTIITHIAPSLHKSHNETAEFMSKDRIEVAFDGMSVEI